MKRELNSELMNTTQTGHMKVSSKILKDLSSGIYSNPANSIKELIINSYDADATKVTVRAKPDLDSFTIIDDGIGMNCEDFDTKFVWISHSDKRKDSDFTNIFKRPKVGRFGIGFLSSSQLCNKMTVISSKKGEPTKFKAEIDFSQYKSHDPYEAPKEIYEVSEYNFINLEEEPDAHYTIIILSELSPGFIDILTDKEIKEKLQEMDDKERKKFERIPLEDISFEDIIDLIIQKNVDEIEKRIGTYWQFMFDIANTVPVSYLQKGPLNIPIKDPILENITSDIDRYNFNVEIDGITLKKPIILPNDKNIEHENSDYNVYYINEDKNVGHQSLKFRGYFYNQKMQIKPVDFQGVLLRIRNVAIGKADKNFLDYPWSEKLYMPWTFGEIYIDEGLEDALNINRNSFAINHPHYMYLRKYIHDMLHDIIFKRARDRYEKRQVENRLAQETKKNQNISKIFEKSKKNPNQVEPEKVELIEHAKVSSETPNKVQVEEERIPELEIVRLSQIRKDLGKYLKSTKTNFKDPVYIADNKEAIIINDRHELFKKHIKKDREILEEILVFF